MCNYTWQTRGVLLQVRGIDSQSKWPNNYGLDMQIPLCGPHYWWLPVQISRNWFVYVEFLCNQSQQRHIFMHDNITRELWIFAFKSVNLNVWNARKGELNVAASFVCLGNLNGMVEAHWENRVYWLYSNQTRTNIIWPCSHSQSTQGLLKLMLELSNGRSHCV